MMGPETIFGRSEPLLGEVVPFGFTVPRQHYYCFSAVGLGYPDTSTEVTTHQIAGVVRNHRHVASHWGHRLAHYWTVTG